MASDWFSRLFLNEAKKAIVVRESWGGGSGDSEEESGSYILIREDGTEIPAVLVSEETVFTATANDIREGAVAATEEGVTVGTKEIPGYYVTEGIQVITNGSEFRIRVRNGDRYNYTKLQAILCPFNTSMTDSVAADKVCINNHVYSVGDTVPLTTVTLDHDNKEIVLGITNDTGSLCIIRHFSYKEEV